MIGIPKSYHLIAGGGVHERESLLPTKLIFSVQGAALVCGPPIGNGGEWIRGVTLTGLCRDWYGKPSSRLLGHPEHGALGNG